MNGEGNQERHRYRFGMFSWFGYRGPMEERMAAIRDAGFSASSVWLGRTEPIVRSGNAHRIPRIVRDSGLEFEYIHGSYANCNKLWSPVASEREIIYCDYSRDIDYCRQHHIPTLVVHISKGLNPRSPREEGLEIIGRLAKQAEDSGVRLAVENTRQPGHLDYILSNLDSPALGFCYDSSHNFLDGEPPGEILKRWGHRLFVTHLSDNDGLSDKHWLPGKGRGAWRSIAEAFPVDTYRGFLTLEVLPERWHPLRQPEFLREGIERLRQFEDLVFSLSPPAGGGATPVVPARETMSGRAP